MLSCAVLIGFIILSDIVLLFLRKLESKEFLLLLCLSVLGFFSLFVIAPEGVVIKRQGYGGDEYEKEIYLEDGEYLDKGSVRVDPLTYTEEELKIMSEEAFEGLSEVFLGNNEDETHIREDLNLVSSIDGYPFEVYWSSSDSEIISSAGVVSNDELKGFINCVVTASLDFGDFSFSRRYPLTVLPKTYSEMDEKKRQALLEIEKDLKKAPREETIALPKMVGEFKVYEEPASYQRALILPGIAILFLLYKRFHEKEEMIKKEKMRRSLLEEAYPDFVSQLLLYMSSGVTVRMAFDALKGYYQSRENESSALLGMELSLTVNEMKSGISEQQAYNNFGKRCGGNRYRKLMALLNQSITVGSKGILLRLDELLSEAFESRKEYAKKRGEEASTKLLIPMILMLATVMALLMVPGFMGMGI